MGVGLRFGGWTFLGLNSDDEECAELHTVILNG